MMDPAGVETYTADATAYVAQLEELHAWTEQQVAMVPEERRLLVTSHDSLGYFAETVRLHRSWSYPGRNHGGRAVC